MGHSPTASHQRDSRGHGAWSAADPADVLSQSHVLAPHGILEKLTVTRSERSPHADHHHASVICHLSTED